MEIRDNFKMWVENCFLQSAHLEYLDKADIEYWALLSRWNLLAAIKLSMGLNPNSSSKKSGKLMESFPTEASSKHGEDYIKRVKLAFAERGKSLIVQEVDARDTGYGGLAREYEVDVKAFIAWARDRFNSNFEQLFELALKHYNNPYKNMAHSDAAAQKGKRADEVKELIAKKAIEELNDGCKCHNSELARYLMKLKNSDGTMMFILPGIIAGQYETHFIKAVNAAFISLGIPLRNQPKIGAPRGKKYCERPGHKT